MMMMSKLWSAIASISSCHLASHAAFRSKRPRSTSSLLAGAPYPCRTRQRSCCRTPFQESLSMLAVFREQRFALLALLLALACLPPIAARAQTEDLPAIMGRITELTREGRFKDAIPLGQRLVNGAEKMAGPEHQMTAFALFTLAE